MSELGDILELMHKASTSFETFAGEFVAVDHPDVAQDAMMEAVKRRSSRIRGARSPTRSHTIQARIHGGPEPADGPQESRILVWSEPPDRYREQEGDGEEMQLVICDGERWWSYDPFMGALTNGNDADPGASTVRGQCEQLLRPSGLLARQRLNVTGRGERAGRAVIAVHGLRSDDRVRSGGASSMDLVGAGDECWLEVDAERGVLLRLESHLRGQPLMLMEARSVSFDEPLSADIFVFVSPDGLQPAAEPDHKPERVAIHEAVHKVPFHLFVLDPAQHHWTSSSWFSAARKRPPLPATVTTTYIAAEGGVSAVVIQQAFDPAIQTTRSITRIERLGSPPIEVLETPGGIACVKTVIGQTQLQLSSSDLDAQQLTELARRVQPAPTAPLHI